MKTKGKRALLRLDHAMERSRTSIDFQWRNRASLTPSLKEEFLYSSANRLQVVAMLRNFRWNRSMESIAAFGPLAIRLVALAYTDFTAEASTVIARDVFFDGLPPRFLVYLHSRQEVASATDKALVQEVKRLQLAGVGGADISSSLADAPYDSAGPSHVGFPLSCQRANQISQAMNQVSLFDSQERPSIVSMLQTVRRRTTPVWILLSLSQVLSSHFVDSKVVVQSLLLFASVISVVIQKICARLVLLGVIVIDVCNHDIQAVPV